MKKLLLAGTSAAAIAISSAAGAADMPLKAAPYASPAPVAYSWTGCYVGAHVGWGWGQSTLNDAGAAHTAAGATTGLFLLGGTLPGSGTVNQSGGIFGGQVGCDYQLGSNFVIGISGSAAGADISGGDTHVGSFSLAGVSSPISAKTDFLADVSGRLGMTWGQALLYGKGGIAWSHNRYAIDSVVVTSTGSDTATGALAGAGIEWKFAPSWSAFVEYDHYFFDTQAVNFTGMFGVPFSQTVNVKQDLDAVKVGLNYRFDWGALATRY
jgi:outer membrane immunogenic protein